jgi:DNA-binding response OmpR family regulator
MSLDQPSTKVFSSKNPSGGAVAAKPAKTREESKPQTKSMRVLIVDDEQEAADALGVMVTSWGHDVRRFYDGATGLAGARAQLPNVALLDITMPGMDGYELARQLRLRSDLHGCYIIAMRASDDLRDVPRMEASIDLFLAKPMNLSVLETLLHMEGERLDRLT